MIKYVQDKKIDYSRIQSLLSQSARLARFSNSGPVKTELEKHLECMLKLPQGKKVVCTSSGTTALHVLMFMLEKIQGKKKWTTIAYNFPSAVVNGLDAAIIDIVNTTNGWKIPIKEIPANSCLVIPTLFGTLPENMSECIDYCINNDTMLVLDNASSPLNKNTNLFTLTDYAFGSLHHTKYLGFGEGGFLVVDEKDYYLADATTTFGFFRDRKYDKLSSNFKMSDVSAAFILGHLQDYSIDSHLVVQEKLVNKLQNNGVTPFGYAEGVVYGNLPIKFNSPKSHLGFRDDGIEANKYYLPLEDLPNSNELYQKMVNFPLHAELLDYEIDKIVGQIAWASQ